MGEIIRKINGDGIVGSITVSDGSVHMDMILSAPIASSEVIKLEVIPNEGRFLVPVNCGTAEMTGNSFSLTSSLNGYKAEDVAEARIIRKNVFTEKIYTIAKVSFGNRAEEIGENIDEIYKKLTYLQEHPAYKAYMSVSEDMKSPVENAAEALERLQAELKAGSKENGHKACMDRILKGVAGYEFAPLKLPKEYKWYKINNCGEYFGISSFEHILSAPDTRSTVNAFGYYILGVDEKNYRVCIAVPVKADAPNPISHADDCTVYLRGDKSLEYCTVCIGFEPDGQYFMPIC